jgi:hypothetical protein
LDPVPEPDPDPFVRGTDPEKFGSKSATKCHGSPTLIFALLDPDPDPMTRLNPDSKHWHEGKRPILQ